MKELLNYGNGAVVLTEQGGEFTLKLSEQAALGGGLAAGIISAKGEGSIVFKGKQGFDLGFKLLEGILPPAFTPVLEGIRTYADALIDQA